jgi:hypothetical protein
MESDPFTQISDFMHKLGDPGHRRPVAARLFVGTEAYAALSLALQTQPNVGEVTWSTQVDCLYGIPVTVESSMNINAWHLVDTGGHIMHSGYVRTH